MSSKIKVPFNKVLIRCMLLNPFQHAYALFRVWSSGLLKTLWKSEKWIEISNSSICTTMFSTLLNNCIYIHKRVSMILSSSFKSCLQQLYRTWEKVNHFPHIDAFWRLCSRRLFENIVTKEEMSYEVKG